ncbi:MULTISPECIES: DMT family transporter [unclassified Paenibacillus]|uniref:DMT family transporter n=1 Tax=unclassified Paenibacillus TaxID=185978 RepID=UPI002F41AFBD
MTVNRNVYWILLIVAGFFEIMWVVGLKHADSVLLWGMTVIAILVSFGLLIHTSKFLPTSTAYAVFVGIGTAGTVVSEMTIFGEPFSWGKIILIIVLLIGIIGLKLVTDEHSQAQETSNANEKGAGVSK